MTFVLTAILNPIHKILRVYVCVWPCILRVYMRETLIWAYTYIQKRGSCSIHYVTIYENMISYTPKLIHRTFTIVQCDKISINIYFQHVFDAYFFLKKAVMKLLCVIYQLFKVPKYWIYINRYSEFTYQGSV